MRRGTTDHATARGKADERGVGCVVLCCVVGRWVGAWLLVPCCSCDRSRPAHNTRAPQRAPRLHVTWGLARSTGVDWQLSFALDCALRVACALGTCASRTGFGSLFLSFFLSGS